MTHVSTCHSERVVTDTRGVDLVWPPIIMTCTLPCAERSVLNCCAILCAGSLRADGMPRPACVALPTRFTHVGSSRLKKNKIHSSCKAACASFLSPFGLTRRCMCATTLSKEVVIFHSTHNNPGITETIFSVPCYLA